MNPDNNVWFAGDFTDPSSARAFQYSGTTLNNAGEGVGHRRSSRTRTRGRSHSRSRSHSPPTRRHRSRSRSRSSSTFKGNKENPDHIMDEGYAEPPSPPEDVPGDAYFNPRRGHGNPYRVFNNNGPRHHYHPHPHSHPPPPPPPADGPASPPGNHPPPPPPPPPEYERAGPSNGPHHGHHGGHHHPNGPFTSGDWPPFFGRRHGGHRGGPWGRHPRGRGGRGGGGAHRSGGRNDPAAAWAGLFQPWWANAVSQAQGGQNQSFDMGGFAKAMAEQFPFMNLGGLDDEEEGNNNDAAGREKGKEAESGKEQDGMDEDFEPLADVYESPAAWIVHVSLPGAKKQDIDLEWAEKAGELKIQGVLTRNTDEDGGSLGKLVLGERDVGLFRKVVSLGTQASGTVDADGISAKMEDGVLAIRVPKRIEEEEFEVVRKVDVA